MDNCDSEYRCVCVGLNGNMGLSYLTKARYEQSLKLFNYLEHTLLARCKRNA